MTLETNLRGRLRNTSLPETQGLLPVFEAVVNSIHSIEDAGIGIQAGKIEVNVLRDTQLRLSDGSGNGAASNIGRQEILGFRIIDNGVGFDSTNMCSFRTLDSDHKASRGGRGVGRLMWLKAFERISVRSVFGDEVGKTTERTFRFSADQGIIDEDDCESADTRSTTIQLEGLKKRYRKSISKTASTIASGILEHCLWYFVRPGAVPKITVTDGDESIDLNENYEAMMHDSATVEHVKIKDNDFDFTHVKMRASSGKSHAIALCAANRLVKQDSLKGKIPGLYGKLRDGDSEFVYVCYVASEFLDERVRSERTDFDISEDPKALFDDQDFSLDEMSIAVKN